MKNNLDIIDCINKQSAIISYLADVSDTSGLSELLVDISKELDLCSIKLEPLANNTKEVNLNTFFSYENEQLQWLVDISEDSNVWKDLLTGEALVIGKLYRLKPDSDHE